MYANNVKIKTVCKAKQSLLLSLALHLHNHHHAAYEAQQSVKSSAVLLPLPFLRPLQVLQHFIVTGAFSFACVQQQ